MKPKPLPPISVLQELISCDPESGALTWKERGLHWFPSNGKGGQKGNQGRWNARFAGKPVCSCKNGTGYLRGHINGQQVVAHRIVWALATGKEPESEIDHINGDRTDNRISNLRAVDHAENAKNAAKPKNNTSGVVGVCWCNPKKKWVAYISADGMRKTLIASKSKRVAIAARRQAEIDHGFHANHGR